MEETSQQPGQSVTGTPFSAEPSQNLTPNSSSSPAAPKSKRVLWLTLAVVAIIVIVAAAVLFWPSKSSAPQETALAKVSIRLGWLNQAQFAGIDVAKEKGFYKNAGFDVTIKEYEDGADVNQEVTDNKSTFGVTTPLEVFVSRDKGNKGKAVAAIYQTSPYAFVSPLSANIKTPADFKGKVLGNVGNNTEATVTYPALMSGYGVSANQVTIKTIDFDIVKDFQDKAADTADIYRTDQTYQLDQAGIKYNLLYPEEFGFNIYGDLIVASDQLIAQKPDMVKKFVGATLAGWSYALAHQDETINILTKYENSLYKDPAYEKYILSASTDLIKPTGNQALGSMQFVPWNRAYNAIKSAGLLHSDFPVSDAYTSEFAR